MKKNEMNEIVYMKNTLIMKQEKRISLLEEKLLELRHKYFQLKYDEQKMDMHLKHVAHRRQA